MEVYSKVVLCLSIRLRYCGQDYGNLVNEYCLSDSGRFWVSWCVNDVRRSWPRVRFTFRSPSLRHCGILHCYLLILSGDVSLNPGPFKHPCTVCSKCVRSNQKALECDGCQMWAHIGCVGVSKKLYSELEAKSQFSWHCPTCLFSELPNVDVVELDTPTSQDQSSFIHSVSLPLAVDALKKPFSGIRIVQGHSF